jgi:hypothetical protein
MHNSARYISYVRLHAELMRCLLKSCITVYCVCVTLSAANADESGAAPLHWPWRGVFLGGGNLPWDGAPSQGNGRKISPGDIGHYAQMGVNAVGIGFTPRQDVNVSQILSKQRKVDIRITPDQAIEQDLAEADALLDACKQNSIVGVITMSQFPVDPNLGFIQNSPRYWNDRAQLDETLRRIGQIARHFANRGDELGAYDFLTEPLLISPNSQSQTPPQWVGFREELIREIRKYDQRHYIVISGGFGGEPGAFKTTTPVHYSKIIYSFHMYDPHSYTHQAIYTGGVGLSYPQPDDPLLNKEGLAKLLQPVVDFQRQNHAYIYVGEFSAVRWAPGAIGYLRDLMDLFDDRHFSWIYFAPGGWNGWDPSYDTAYYTNALGYNDFTHYVGFDTPCWQLLNREWERNIKH